MLHTEQVITQRQQRVMAQIQPGLGFDLCKEHQLIELMKIGHYSSPLLLQRLPLYSKHKAIKLFRMSGSIAAIGKAKLIPVTIALAFISSTMYFLKTSHSPLFGTDRRVTIRDQNEYPSHYTWRELFQEIPGLLLCTSTAFQPSALGRKE